MGKGKKHYDQLISSNFQGVADKIKEARKDPRKQPKKNNNGPRK